MKTTSTQNREHMFGLISTDLHGTRQGNSFVILCDGIIAFIYRPFSTSKNPRGSGIGFAQLLGESISTRNPNQGNIMAARKRFWFSASAGSLLICLLTACNTQAPQSIEVESEVDADRFHEKSFSWDTSAKEGSLAKSASLVTRFETAEELASAVIQLDEDLKKPGVSDSLWKPVDYACDELGLALWNRYGTLYVKDSLVLNEETLKAGCNYIGDNATLGKVSKTQDFEGAVVDDRQYPYKMIGESWDDNSDYSLGTTGSSTSFKKHRKKLFTTAWWDTDASKLGVRIYLFKCTFNTPKICLFEYTHADRDYSDDYVSFRVASTIKTPEDAPLPPGYGPGRAYYKRNDAVIGMHSVDHAGLQFRASSTSGFRASYVVADVVIPEYITW